MNRVERLRERWVEPRHRARKRGRRRSVSLKLSAAEAFIAEKLEARHEALCEALHAAETAAMKEELRRRADIADALHYRASTHLLGVAYLGEDPETSLDEDTLNIAKWTKGGDILNLFAGWHYERIAAWEERIAEEEREEGIDTDLLSRARRL